MVLRFRDVELVARGPVVRLGARPGPGHVEVPGDGLPSRAAVLLATGVDAVNLAPVDDAEVWFQGQRLTGPTRLPVGSAFVIGPLEAGTRVTLVALHQPVAWQGSSGSPPRIAGLVRAVFLLLRRLWLRFKRLRPLQVRPQGPLPTGAAHAQLVEAVRVRLSDGAEIRDRVQLSPPLPHDWPPSPTTEVSWYAYAYETRHGVFGAVTLIGPWARLVLSPDGATRVETLGTPSGNELQGVEPVDVFGHVALDGLAPAGALLLRAARGAPEPSLEPLIRAALWQWIQYNSALCDYIEGEHSTLIAWARTLPPVYRRLHRELGGRGDAERLARALHFAKSRGSSREVEKVRIAARELEARMDQFIEDHHYIENLKRTASERTGVDCPPRPLDQRSPNQVLQDVRDELDGR